MLGVTVVGPYSMVENREYECYNRNMEDMDKSSFGAEERR